MIKSTKQKPGAAIPVVTDTVVTDIPHEEVKHSENGVSIAAKVITPEDQIEIEVKKFDIAEAGIEILKEKYGGLVINGPDDKAGYKAVREAWRDVQSKRTGTEKKGLELRNGYGIITKGIKKKQDILVELMLPLEEELYTKWKAIDEAKEKIQKEKEEEEQRQMMVRVEEVLGLGMVFSGGFYCVGDDISMDVATLRALPVDQYEKLKEKIVAKVTEIAAAKAADLEKQRLEAQRLQKEKDELARQQRELQEQQAEMNRQREELENQKREAAKLKVENRINSLIGLGMVKRDFDLKFDNGFKGFTIAFSQIESSNDIDFPDLLNKTTETISIFNKEKSDHEEQVNQEKAVKAAKEKFISEKMVEVGLTYNYNSKKFEFISGLGEKYSLSYGFENFMSLSEKEIEEWGKNIRANVDAAKEELKKQEKEKAEAAANEERLAMTDQEVYNLLILYMVESIGKIGLVSYKTKKFKARSEQLRDRLIAVVNEFQ